MASLIPFASILGIKNARHLLRRACFVYSKSLINQLSTLTPNEALDLLFAEIDPLISLPYDPYPTNAPDGFWTTSQNSPISYSGQDRKASIVAAWWWYNSINSPNLKYKLCHFLSTRFTVEKGNGAGSATEFYDHIKLLLFYSFGNYKTLAKKMTLNNSMLIYLNNTSNVKTAPNENYAREFLELFTIGKGNQIASGDYTNYKETDIVQAAKVLTGYKRDPERTVIDSETGIPRGKKVFSDHDTSVKIFSNAFNNTIINPASDENSMEVELNDFIEMIFNKVATAQNICRKLYAYFVRSTISEEVENDIIIPLALELYNNNYELVPTVKRLLGSLHFYDLDDGDNSDETVGAIFKSPLQQLSEICSYLSLSIPNPQTEPESYYITFWDSFVHNIYLKGANMILFDPENVAGHPAYYQTPDFDKNWISASSLIARYRLPESLIDGKNRIDGNAEIGAKINLTEMIRYNGLISVPDNPYILTSELCNALFAQETTEERINYFMNNFLLQGQPVADWTSLWSYYIEANFNSVVDLRLNSLLNNILKSPETQLF